LKEYKKGSFAKQDDEFEVEVSDFEVMQSILTRAGFIAKKLKSGRRTSYKLLNSLIEIQEYFVIPTYLEIESPNETEIKKIMGILGLSSDKVRNWHGFELFDHYGVEY
jgi:adenylate cyclase class IV